MEIKTIKSTIQLVMLNTANQGRYKAPAVLFGQSVKRRVLCVTVQEVDEVVYS